jgi:hypothetical protein
VTEAGALDAIDRILNRGGDADDVLREVVRVLPAQVPGLTWAGVSFLEEGRLVPGPSAGEPDDARRVRVPVSYRGDRVGELAVDGVADAAFLERVATLISAHVLIGWDTRGERWEP